MVDVGMVLNGRYRLDREVGRGAFARVFLASDLRLERRVAIKVLHPGLSRVGPATGGRDLLALLGAEARLVAALEHPNILPVYDAGEAAGTPFVVMAYAPGGTLDEILRRAGSLSPDRVAVYLRQAAAALDYAHTRGVVHRDVKPANMLLSEDGRLLLADFGIAKVLDAAGASGPTGVKGTPAYMAPEQFQGSAGSATDIYSLGCVTFHLLTGERPYPGSIEQALYGHLHGPIPSVVERSRGRVPAAAQAVLNRAMAKDPMSRFPTATALAEAFQTAIVPTVPPASPAGSSDGRVRRRALLAGAAALGVSWAALAGVFVTRGRDGDRNAPSPLPTSTQAAVASVGSAPGGMAPRTPSLTIAPTPESTGTAGAVAPPSVLSTTSPNPRASPARPPLPSQVAVTFVGHTNGVNSIAWAPDGQTLATAADDDTVRLWRTDGTQLRSLTDHRSNVYAVAWAPDGATLASSGYDLLVRLRGSDGTSRAELRGHTDRVRAVAWAPGGALLASGADDTTVRLWRADGTPAGILNGHTAPVLSVAWAPDGAMLASAGSDRTVQLWRTDGTPLRRLTDHTGIVAALAWAPGTTILASGAYDRTVRLWRADGSALIVLNEHAGSVRGLAWTPDGQVLASGSDDTTVRLWRANGTSLAVLSGHAGGVNSVAWSPDGRTLASASEDSTVHLWR